MRFRLSKSFVVAFWALLSTACATSHVATSEHVTTQASTSLPGYIRVASGSNSERVIVFVHGIFGDGRTTWTNTTTGAYFPELVASDDTFRGASVWVHQFPSPKLAASYSIDELADHLRRHLSHDNVLRNHRQVVFVAHSMGGLVVRALLLKYRDLLPPGRVALLYFFSTPTTGADIASYTRLLSNNPQLGDMRKMRTNESGVLAIYDAQWRSAGYISQVRSFCAYETLTTFGIQVVQRESAENLCNTRPDPIRSNHIEIVKPSGPADESFIAFREAYREVFDTHEAQTSRRRPMWNLRDESPAFVRVSPQRAKPSCADCWSSQMLVGAGDSVYVAVHYENLGHITAQQTSLVLEVPSDAMSDPLIYTTLRADGAPPLQGAACIAPQNGPVILVPISAEWYPNGSDKPLPLPYDQVAAAVTSEEGLRLGDVSVGTQFASDVVIEYRAIPITAVAVRDIEQWARRAESLFRDRAGLVDIRELGKEIIEDDNFRIERGVIDFSDELAPLGWVSSLDSLRHDEAIFLTLFIANDYSEAIRDSVVIAKQEHDGRLGYVSFELQAANYSSHIARVPVSYAKGASRLVCEVVFALPENFCSTFTHVSDYMSHRIEGDVFAGIPIGNIPPRSGTTLQVGFTVQ